MFITCKKVNSDKSQTTIGISQNSILGKIKNKTEKNILVCAHRSFHKFAPENSLQSIKKAIEAQIDFVELDVRTTKDNILVLMHDDSIGRVSTGKGFVKDYTYKELQRFNLKINDSITNEKIPLLKDALRLAKGKVIPNLDLKAVNYKQLYSMLKAYDMEHEVISFIGKKEKVMEMIGIDSLYATLPLSKTKEDVWFYTKNTRSALQHFTEESFTPQMMKLAMKNNQLIFINTLWNEDDDFILGNTESMDRVIALKPAIIQTDHPKLLLEYLRSKNLHN
ncbi:hypothetical protein GCM10022395_31350 [Snuella lapsa]|uniref:GP-PDE domain-containing protein n=1 Tax=Snuella lapsa TaxID=870481 RepID=A0ABP6YCZ6_9FLAO